MGSPAGLTTRGWKKTELKAGDRITIEGFGAKDGKNVMAENYSGAFKPLPGHRRNN